MDEPLLASNYPFTSAMRSPWLTTAGDNMTLPAPAEESNWASWMRWDAQQPETKPGTAQGDAASFPDPSRRPHAHSQTQSLPPHTIPTSAPMYSQPNGVPFTFGQSIDGSPAFDFNGHTLSSPHEAELQQQNGFYSPPVWQQQQQQQQMTDNAFYATSRFEQASLVAPHPPVSTPSLHHSPASLNNGRASSSSAHSSPEPAVNSKKRKQSEEEDDDLDSMPAGKKGGQPPKKTAHNMIEKRYRTNLNDKIAALRDSEFSIEPRGEHVTNIR
jgi:hypothetical protein